MTTAMTDAPPRLVPTSSSVSRGPRRIAHPVPSQRTRHDNSPSTSTNTTRTVCTYSRNAHTTGRTKPRQPNVNTCACMLLSQSLQRTARRHKTQARRHNARPSSTEADPASFRNRVHEWSQLSTTTTPPPTTYRRATDLESNLRVQLRQRLHLAVVITRRLGNCAAHGNDHRHDHPVTKTRACSYTHRRQGLMGTAARGGAQSNCGHFQYVASGM